MSIDLIFSDIHGDIEALNTILDISTSKEFQKKFGNIKRVINLGDILGRGTHPVQVINKLKLLQKMYDFISVIGNHDESFLYKKTIAVYPKESVEAHSSLTKKDLEIFQKNSDGSFGLQEFFDKKNNIVFVHGGPLNQTEIHYNYFLLIQEFLQCHFPKQVNHCLTIPILLIQMFHTKLKEQ